MGHAFVVAVQVGLGGATATSGVTLMAEMVPPLTAHRPAATVMQRSVT